MGGFGSGTQLALADAAVAWQQIARDLARLAGTDSWPFAELAARRTVRFLGDFSAEGRGELMIAMEARGCVAAGHRRMNPSTKDPRRAATTCSMPNMMAQCKSHTAIFAIRACNQLVRLATIVVPKVTLKDMANVDLYSDVVQSATADAVVDCLVGGVIPRSIANELCIISPVWIDPRCAKDPNLD